MTELFAEIDDAIYDLECLIANCDPTPNALTQALRAIMRDHLGVHLHVGLTDRIEFHLASLEDAIYVHRRGNLNECYTAAEARKLRKVIVEHISESPMISDGHGLYAKTIWTDLTGQVALRLAQGLRVRVDQI